MRACHTCAFNNNGWCTRCNQGVSAGGRCSKWSGSGNLRKDPYEPRSKRKTLMCRNCYWWKAGTCTNKRSQAYNLKMLQGSLCTAFEHWEKYSNK